MRLQLHNIGPIRDATVVVQPLTVLIGPNGSGKTTVSTIAYAAAQANLKARRGAGWSFLRRAARLGESDEVIDIAKRLVANWEDEFRNAFQRELQRCAGPDLLRLGREGRAGRGAAPRILVSNGKKPGAGWQLVFRIQKDGLVLERSSNQYRSPLIPLERPAEKGRPTSPSAYERQLRGVLQGGMPYDVVYFPAARSGLMQMHTTLTGLMLNAIGAGYMDHAAVGRVPGTAIDFVQSLARLDPDDEASDDDDVARYLEESVLHGSVSLQVEGGSRVVQFTPNGLEGAIDIEFAATSAAELAPLILYLRHSLGHGDCIFIDEPEAHFHPENQVALADGLLRLARGVQGLVIATHSEFLVSGISNALLAAGKHNGGTVPRPSVHIYEFYCDGSETGRGFKVMHHEVDPDQGFDIHQFSAVAEVTYEQGITLYNALHASEPAP
jgi:RecA/RadA recombinase